MNLRRSLLVVLGLVGCVVGGVANAHQYENCESIDNKGCWHSINRTQETVVVDCNQGEFMTRLFSGQSYTYQFCPGWGDGLGYPQPDTYYKCSITFSSGEMVPLAFSTINWGDRVQILIQRENVTIQLRAYWSSQLKTFQFPRRGP